MITPQKGRSMDLLMMANRNAENLFKIELLGKENSESALEQLKEKLSLKNIHRTIECFDISNVSGKHAVGSQVTFINGRPFKKGYRRYRIKTVDDMDDYRMMREVLERRYKKNEHSPEFFHFTSLLINYTDNLFYLVIHFLKLLFHKLLLPLEE